MGLKDELKKQGRWGIANMVLAILGATGFFSWLFFGLWGHISRDLLIDVFFILLLASSVITLISRRQISEIKQDIQNEKVRADYEAQRAKESHDKANKKIEEVQNNAFERIHKAEQEVELKKAEFYEVLQVNKDFTDRMVSEAELKAKFDCEKKVAQWISDCQFLYDQNKQLKDIQKLISTPGATGSGIYPFLKPNSNGDDRLVEIQRRLNKDKI